MDYTAHFEQVLTDKCLAISLRLTVHKNDYCPRCRSHLELLSDLITVYEKIIIRIVVRCPKIGCGFWLSVLENTETPTIPSDFRTHNPFNETS